MIEEDQEQREIPELNLIITIITGTLFVGGGIAQLLIGQSYPYSGNLMIALMFLVPGAIGLLVGVVNLAILTSRNRKVAKEVMQEKYGYLFKKEVESPVEDYEG